MKLFTFALLTILNVWMACARPDYAEEINKSDDKFHYWVSYDTMTATVMNVVKAYENANTLTLNPTLKVQGKTFIVNQIGAAAFSNNNVKNLIIPSSIKSINISPMAFFNSYIDSIEFNCKEVTVTSEQSFDGINKHVYFKGEGVKSLVDNYSKYLLKQWNLPIGYTGYNEKSDPKDTKRLHDLYTLAKNIKKHVTYQEGIAHGDTAATALLLGVGNSEGIARAFYTMSLDMGVPFIQTYVGFDGKYYKWNYVKVIKDEAYREWYNVDIVHYNFRSSYSKTLFQSVATQKSVLKKAYNLSSDAELDFMNWQIYENRYNYPGEWKLDGPFMNQLYGWLVRNRSCCFHE